MHSTIDQALPLHTHIASNGHTHTQCLMHTHLFFKPNGNAQKSFFVKLHMKCMTKTMSWNQCWEPFKCNGWWDSRFQIKITIKSKHWSKHHAKQRDGNERGKRAVRFPTRKFIIWFEFQLDFQTVSNRFIWDATSVVIVVIVIVGVGAVVRHKSLCYIIHFVCAVFFYKARLFRLIVRCLDYQWIPRFWKIKSREKGNQQTIN